MNATTCFAWTVTKSPKLEIFFLTSSDLVIKHNQFTPTSPICRETDLCSTLSSFYAWEQFPLHTNCRLIWVQSAGFLGTTIPIQRRPQRHIPAAGTANAIRASRRAQAGPGGTPSSARRLRDPRALGQHRRQPRGRAHRRPTARPLSQRGAFKRRGAIQRSFQSWKRRIKAFLTQALFSLLDVIFTMYFRKSLVEYRYI